MDHKLYLGPYARCKNTKVRVNRTLRTCPTAACAQYGQYTAAKHCCDCGLAITETAFSGLSPKVSTADVRDEISERLQNFSFDGVDVWFPNLTSNRDMELVGEDEITVEVPKKETEAFSSLYASVLATFRYYYGEKAVVVCWGLLGEYR
jgi:hypothetical protein